MPAMLSRTPSRHSPATSSGSSTAQPDTVPKEKECMLCHRMDADTDICGDKKVKFKLCVHTYCQLLATGLFPRENEAEIQVGDTRRIIREAAKKSCFVCYNMGATITCCQTGCDRTFHLPCAPDGQCVTQYFGAYRSFCWEHRPQQALQARPSHHNTCSICLDTVEDKISYKTMGCPTCQDARFHRHCIQRLALHAGITFRCPCCLNQEPFTMEMLIMGIRLSKRPPSWQSDPAVGPSDQRHSSCDAPKCLCPAGRQHVEEDGPWQLQLCSSCAAQGTHRHCSSLGNTTCSWECSTCAGTDTGSTGTADLVSPSTASNVGSTLPQLKGILKNSRSLRPRKTVRWRDLEERIPAQTMKSPPAKHHRIQDGPAHTADTCKPSTPSQAPSRLSQGTCPAKSSSSSSGPRQAFKRAYPKEGNDSATSYSLPAKHRRIQDGPAHSADTCKPSNPKLVPSQLSQGTCPPHPRQAFKRGHSEEDNRSGISDEPPAKRRRMDYGPAQSADESSPCTSTQPLPGLAEGTLAPNTPAAQLPHTYSPPWIFHGSTTDNRSQPGPIRMRHVRRQQRRAKKPYSRTEKHSSNNWRPAHSPHPPSPSNSTSKIKN